MLLDQFDLSILKFTTSFVGVSDAFDRAVYGLANFDLFKGVVMMALLWLAWFRPVPRETQAQRDARQVHLLTVFSGTLITVLISRVLQLTLHVHQRPILAGLGLPFPHYTDPTAVNKWNSFPSDHSMLFFALATGLWQSNRLIGGIAYFWAFFMIDLPRVYCGVHYPSDILAGAVLGVLCMLALERTPLPRLSGRMLAWSKTHPGLFYTIAFLTTEQLAHLFDDIRDIGTALVKYFLGMR